MGGTRGKKKKKKKKGAIELGSAWGEKNKKAKKQHPKKTKPTRENTKKTKSEHENANHQTPGEPRGCMRWRFAGKGGRGAALSWRGRKGVTRGRMYPGSARGRRPWVLTAIMNFEMA